MEEKTSRQQKAKRKVIHFVAGAAAGAISKTCTAPLERLKILFQVQDMKSSGSSVPRYGRSLLRCFGLIIHEEGITGLFKGNMANVIRVMPMYSIKLAMNDTFKKLFENSPNNSLSLTQLIFSGTLAGLVQISLTYPFEMVRTRLALSASWGVNEKSVFRSIKSISKTEGITALYKGFGPCILTGTPCIAIQLALFEHLKKNPKILGLSRENNPDSLIVGFVNGSICGLISQSLTYWGDTIKRRMQSDGIGNQSKVYKSAFDCAKQIFLKEGIIGFHRGFIANVYRSIPSTTIQLLSYDYLKRILKAD